MREKIKEIMEKSNKVIYENELYVRLQDVTKILNNEETADHNCKGCFGAENNDCDTCPVNCTSEWKEQMMQTFLGRE